MNQPLFEHHLELGGYRTRALELEGEGAPLILLHGFADSADTWRRLLARLGRAGRRAIAFDLPGFATADPLDADDGVLAQLDRFAAAAVEHVARETGGEVVLAGNSLGGAVALRAAEDASLPLRGIVPIAPAGLDMPRWFSVIEREPLVRWLLASPVPLPPQVMRVAVGEVYRQLAFARPREAAHEVVRSFTAHHADRRAVARYLDNGRRMLPELVDPFDLASIAVPVLLIWGERDRMVPSRGRASRSWCATRRSSCSPTSGTARRSRRPSASGRCWRPSSTTPSAPPRTDRSENAHHPRQFGAYSAFKEISVHLVPRPDELGRAAANVFDTVFRGGLADLRRTPASIIDEAPQCTVYRHLVPDAGAQHELPVLLVPPLAAPTVCFDLRRGCSLTGHLLAKGHPTYLVEYGEIAFSDRDLGLEHWVDDVIPRAIRRVSDDAGGLPVQVVGWCLGGIMSLLAAAGDPSLPVNSVSMIASPFDFTRVPLLSPLRPLAALTGGRVIGSLGRVLGGAPAPLVRRGFQLSSLDKELTKPWAILRSLDDRDALSQMEAVDHFMANMHAYPGRTFGQLYHRFFRVNDLAGGEPEIGGRTIRLADVRFPVLSVAGAGDTLAPKAAVHAVSALLPNAAQVRLETGPGGHLGVLTGRGARTTTWAWLDDFLAEHGRVTEATPIVAPSPPRRPHLRVVA